MSVPDRTIPLRELRNQVSRVLREVQDGSSIRVTVDGRPVADLVPVSERRTWVPWPEIQRLLRAYPPDAAFAKDIAGMDQPMRDDDPWTR